MLAKTIPPLAHFIWAGGTKLFPEEGIENVSQWISLNKNIEGFQAWLWVDKKTALKDIAGTYKRLFKVKGIILLTEEEAEKMDITIIKPPPVILKDIEKNELRNEFVAYEIDRLRPNYGSSSDLLRYEILFRFGGFYCDCTDVKPGRDSLAVIFSQKHSRENVMYLEHCPQQPNAEKQKLETFQVGELGNDTFATNQSNNAALQMIVSARKNYDLPIDNFDKKHIIIAHSGNNIKDITIERTGPGLVRQVLLGQMKCQEKLKGILVDDSKNEIHRFRDGKLELVTPGSNTGNWLNVRITKYGNPKGALEQVIKTIEFEAKHLKVLRLDDHINDLIASTEDQIKPAMILERLHEVIQKNAKFIKYTQLTGEFKESIGYSVDNKLLNIFNLEGSHVIEAINAQCYLNDFLKAEQTAIRLKDKLTQPAQEQNLSIVGLILRSQRLEVMQQLCQQMALGIKYMEHFSQQLDTYAKNTSVSNYEQVKQHLVDRLQKYKEYTVLLNDKVEVKYQVDAQLIDKLLMKLAPQTEKNIVEEQAIFSKS